MRSLQERLRVLRFWVGPVDGIYGPLTEQAVLAAQKAYALPLDGVASTEFRDTLAAAPTVTPYSTSGTLVEINKTRQLLLFVADGATQWIFNTSTGTELPYWHPNGQQLLADTPPGHHTFFSQYDGTQPGELGPLYRPKYFHHDGIAIHGYRSVPAAPASHGCVRVTFAAMDFIWARGLAPIGSEVWVYGTSPPPITAR